MISFSTIKMDVLIINYEVKFMEQEKSFFKTVCNIAIPVMMQCMLQSSFSMVDQIMVGQLGSTSIAAVGLASKFSSIFSVVVAAIATVVSQIVNCMIMLVAFVHIYQKEKRHFVFSLNLGAEGYRQYAVMLIPILITEFMWSLGENVYASIYGHMGTQACAAMTLTNPIQGLFIGALSGISQAAGIIIGKNLGKRNYDKAFQDSKRLVLYGLFGAIALSILLIMLRDVYINIYQVDDTVKYMTRNVLLAFACIAPVKVLNMILAGGIIRSGGKTKLVMWIDLTGTWIFGVPLGLITAFLLNLPIFWVYFILSLEEAVRLFIAFIVFHKKSWMHSLEHA